MRGERQPPTRVQVVRAHCSVGRADIESADARAPRRRRSPSVFGAHFVRRLACASHLLLTPSMKSVTFALLAAAAAAAASAAPFNATAGARAAASYSIPSNIKVNYRGLYLMLHALRSIVSE